jgi:hypothetical protein
MGGEREKQPPELGVEAAALSLTAVKSSPVRGKRGLRATKPTTEATGMMRGLRRVQ